MIINTSSRRTTGKFLCILKLGKQVIEISSNVVKIFILNHMNLGPLQSAYGGVSEKRYLRVRSS